jgi:hypothetical protein
LSGETYVKSVQRARHRWRLYRGMFVVPLSRISSWPLKVYVRAPKRILFASKRSHHTVLDGPPRVDALRGVRALSEIQPNQQTRQFYCPVDGLMCVGRLIRSIVSQWSQRIGLALWYWLCRFIFLLEENPWTSFGRLWQICRFLVTKGIRRSTGRLASTIIAGDFNVEFYNHMGGIGPLGTLGPHPDARQIIMLGMLDKFSLAPANTFAPAVSSRNLFPCRPALCDQWTHQAWRGLASSNRLYSLA